MRLLEAYTETEICRLERVTKEAIEKIMINPGVQSSEYTDRYNAIMDNYRLEGEILRNIRK